jgi:hypothetical protein
LDLVINTYCSSILLAASSLRFRFSFYTPRTQIHEVTTSI